MSAPAWIVLGAGIALWIAAAFFFTGPIIRHLFWLRWQRRHHAQIDIEIPWGRDRL